MSTKTDMDDLIGSLSEELTPVKPASPYGTLALWFLLSSGFLVAFVSYLGLRHDFFIRLTDSIFLFELGSGLALLFSSALTSSYLNFPDGYQKDWMKGVPLSIFGMLLLWIAVRSIEEGASFMKTTALNHCAEEGLLLQIIPAAAIMFLTMRGHTTKPYWSMFMNVLAISALGWIGLRLTCTMDVMGHTLMNHVMPFVVIGAGLGFFAKKLFKW